MPVFKTKVLPTGQTPPVPLPGALTQSGPVVQIQVEVSSPLSQRLVADKQSVPPPVSGAGLVDTGATFSAIDLKVVSRLGLQPIGAAITGTAAGRRPASVYAVKFTLPGARIAVEDGHVLGVDLDGTGMVALLGRSFLQNTVLIYDGLGSEFTIMI